MTRFFLGLVIALGLAGRVPQSVSPAFSPFGTVTLAVDFAVNGAGRNVDTIAFWEAPNERDSLMFVGAKSSELVEVWRFPYASPDDEHIPLTHACISAGTNGVIVDQEANLLYISMVYSATVCVFSVPDLAYVTEITLPGSFRREPNLALLKVGGGETRLYVSDDDIVYIVDPASGVLLSTFIPVAGLETMYGDNYEQILYIPDENERTGVYAYDPDGNLLVRSDRSRLGDSTVFDSDAEGIFVYTCPSDGTSDNGQGFIVVSDQIEDATIGNDFEFFDRQTGQYLGHMKLTLPDGSYVYNTDGIASTQRNSTRFAGGLFVAIHDDSETVGLSWQTILSATGLNCDTGQDHSPG